MSRNGNNGTNGDKGDTGDTGPTGPTGPAGPNLVGLQSGTTGWVITDVTSNTRGGILVKKSTDPTVSNLTASSKIQAANFYATSDKRLKENIEAADEKHLIKTFDSLGLKEFNFKQDQADLPLPDGKQVGLIAQELQEVAPSDLQDCFIRKGYDGYLSINENKLVYLCIAKIHELEQEIKELKDKVK